MVRQAGRSPGGLMVTGEPGARALLSSPGPLSGGWRLVTCSYLPPLPLVPIMTALESLLRNSPNHEVSCSLPPTDFFFPGAYRVQVLPSRSSLRVLVSSEITEELWLSPKHSCKVEHIPPGSVSSPLQVVPHGWQNSPMI